VQTPCLRARTGPIANSANNNNNNNNVDNAAARIAEESIDGSD